MSLSNQHCQHPPSRLCHEVLDCRGPNKADARIIYHLRSRCRDNVCKQLDGCENLVAALGYERESEVSDFVQSQAERPHVRFDGVGLAEDPFRLSCFSVPLSRNVELTAM